MARVRLGDLLVEAQMISSEQLEGVLAAQKHDGRRLGTLLVESGLVTETQVTQILSQQLAIPWVSLYHIDFSRQLLNLVPREFTIKYCLVPIFVRRVRGLGETLYVAMDDPTDDRAIASIGEYSGLPVRAMIAPPSDIQAAIRVYYGADDDTAAENADAENADAENADAENADAEADEAVTTRKLSDTHPESPSASRSEGGLRKGAPAKPGKAQVAPKPEAADEERVTKAAGPEQTPSAPAPAEDPQPKLPASKEPEPDATESPNSDEATAEREVESRVEEGPHRGEEASTLDIVVDVDEMAAATAAVVANRDEAAEKDTEVARARQDSEPLIASAPAPEERSDAMAPPNTSEAAPVEAPPSGTAPEPIPESDEAPAPTSDRVAARRVDMPQPAAAKRGKMVSLTLLDGTTISLPAKGAARGATAKPEAASGDAGEELLTARDLVAALRAASHGADASEILGENAQWESMFAALLSLLLKKHLIADWEFVEEYKKI